ncbi:MAG: hypothetical protein M5U23_09550 [Acidimicrobiia bacterium]|nr:hypothetical protein [Acidimicrobiia bacterium]
METFIVRLWRNPSGSFDLRGSVVHIRSGTTQQFDTGDRLLDILKRQGPSAVEPEAARNEEVL